MIQINTMESAIIDNLPTEILNIMTSLFEKGNIVNSYRMTGNAHGFSITLQLYQSMSTIHSGSPLMTPRSKRLGKSPSTLQRDQHRMNAYLSTHECSPSSSPYLAHQNERVSTHQNAENDMQIATDGDNSNGGSNGLTLSDVCSGNQEDASTIIKDEDVKLRYSDVAQEEKGDTDRNDTSDDESAVGSHDTSQLATTGG